VEGKLRGIRTGRNPNQTARVGSIAGVLDGREGGGGALEFIVIDEQIKPATAILRSGNVRAG